ncbi:MAG: T9SS type A sorting domain-containing protein [Bacteroidetes bacterium]|nr:T9SS type A sorting domain-containing protein [Bacteroidota bacterium]
MKKLLLLLMLLAGFEGISQTADTLYHEDFETGGTSFTLNTADMSSSAGTTGYNEWVINDAYDGGTGQLVCLGIPTTFTVPNTQLQPVGTTGGSSTFYMHITSDAATAAGIYNCSDLAANGLCGNAEFNFTAMNQDINVAGYDSVTTTFIWLCDGSQNIYGELYYSTDSGISWTLATGGTAQYRNQPTWANKAVTMPIAPGTTTFRIGFRFVNQVSLTANDPGFGIDEIHIIGKSTAAAPVAAFSVSDSSVCANTCVDFTDLSTGNPTSWFWIFSGATPSFSTSQNPTAVCYNSPGNYPVSLIVNGPGGSDTLTAATMIVNAIPGAPVITVSGDTLFATPGFATYQWSLNGVAISGATNNSYLTTTGGIYEVAVSDSNGCTAISASIIVTTSLATIDDLPVYLFPNPASEYIHLQTNTTVISLNISDLTGRKIKEVSSASNRELIDVREFTSGIYVITIITENQKQFHQKIVIQ